MVRIQLPRPNFQLRRLNFQASNLPGFWVRSRAIRSARIECLTAKCDQIPTLAKNQLVPYSEHGCAHRPSHGPGKLPAKEKPESLMSAIIPLELQRRCEQRWAARFIQPAPAASQRQSDTRDSGAASSWSDGVSASGASLTSYPEQIPLQAPGNSTARLPRRQGLEAWAVERPFWLKS